MEGSNQFEFTREDNQSDAGVFEVFQIYDCWSAEKVKILPCLELSMEVRGIGIQKYFRMACCFWNRKVSSWSVNSES